MKLYKQRMKMVSQQSVNSNNSRNNSRCLVNDSTEYIERLNRMSYKGPKNLSGKGLRSILT